eukprot:TRINITY_DN16732_c0_g1_i1.p1 TRINITY_DN16732_c0_g1~~TRINITY_DN16732_c0_g1_i1.p1  ORF type:complete len:298 (+),score=41.64 TRINITY_DN16732_c0_g1_i1:52-945(+)
MLFASSHVGGALQTLLLQGALPLTMMLSLIFLGARYNFIQIGAAIAIVGGIVISVIPNFSSIGKVRGQFYWIVIYLVLNIPAAVSTVFKEYIFKTRDYVSILYLLLWDGVFQFIAILFLLPIDLIPDFGSVPPDRLFKHVSEGVMCFFRHYPENPTSDMALSSSGDPMDDCDTAWIPTMALVFFYVTSQMCIQYLVKYGSAAFYYLALTIPVPLANIAFSFEFLMGDKRSPLSTYDILALGVILFGLCVYHYYASTDTSRQAKRLRTLTKSREGSDKQTKPDERTSIVDKNSINRDG